MSDDLRDLKKERRRMVGGRGEEDASVFPPMAREEKIVGVAFHVVAAIIVLLVVLGFLSPWWLL